MPDPSDNLELLRLFAGSRVVAYRPRLATMLGDVKAALLLSQLVYQAFQQEDSSADFSVLASDLEEQTGLSIKEQRSARTLLVKKQVLACERRGTPYRYFYRIRFEVLSALSAGQMELPIEAPKSVSNGRSASVVSDNSECPDGTVQSVPVGQSRVSQTAHLECPDGTVSKIKSLQEGALRKTARKHSASAMPRPPAIELHRRLTHRYLHKSTWPTVNRVIGSGFPALLRWGRLVRAWKLAGYNVTNAKGMLEVYRNGWQRRGGPEPRDPNYSAAKDTAEFNRKRAAARAALGQAKRLNREAVDG